MKFSESPLRGAFLIEPEEQRDDRGSFARTFCRQEFADHGLNVEIAQRSTSVNTLARTLRGMHYQSPPHAESKTIRCVRGSVYDVIIDLRPQSATYCKWFGVELTAQNRKMLYVPPGLAHGFLTLTEGAELDYQMSQEHVPQASRGVRWDDPTFGIQWPSTPLVLSARDRAYPDFRRL